VLAFWGTFFWCWLCFITSAVRAKSWGPSDPDFPFFLLLIVMPSLFFASLALLVAPLGYFWGKDAAMCRSIWIAFLRGAGFCGAIAGAITMLVWIGSFLMQTRRDSFFELCAMLFSRGFALACFGAFLSGVSAIYVRDFRALQRSRLLPQFTMQEMLVIFTLLGIIISITTSSIPS
jgi:hypothetical protein